MSKTFRFSLVLAAAVLLAQPAAATTALKLSDAELVAGADLIVTGEVLSTESTWLDGTLVTVASVRVDDSLKGDAGSTLTLVLPGGVDLAREIPVAMTYAGAPSVVPGEQVFLFVQEMPEAAGTYFVMGFSQGLFTISPAGNGEMEQNLSGLSLRTGGSTVEGTVRSETVTDFKNRVRRLLVEGGVQ